MISDIITIVANLALALSFLVALVFGIAQVKAVERDRRERLTLEALRKFQTHAFAEHIQYIASSKVPKSREELNNSPVSEQVMFIQFSQEMESLGILVAEGLVDVELVDKTLGSFVATSWEKYKPIFLDIRQKAPDPFLGEYFQWLAEQITKRMQENPRKPFYDKSTLPS